MFQRPREAIGVPVLVLSAVLTYVREAHAVIVFGSPGIVESVLEAIHLLNRSHDASRCCSLHNLTCLLA
jgi:hypothetical protein